MKYSPTFCNSRKLYVYEMHLMARHYICDSMCSEKHACCILKTEDAGAAAQGSSGQTLIHSYVCGFELSFAHCLLKNFYSQFFLTTKISLQPTVSKAAK